MGAFDSALTEVQLAQMGKAGYEFAGRHRHSAAKACLWTKKSIRLEGECYKSKFYGIASHRCLQMSPAIPFCNHACVFCWRNPSLHNLAWKGGADSPKEIIDGCIQAQRHLLNGFPGNPKASIGKWREAQQPAHAAISLDGEPTLYPMLPQLIKEFHERGMTTFLVTNGSRPDALMMLDDNGALPTQLYISFSSYDAESYAKTSVPMYEGAWEKFNESLGVLAALKGKTRTVLRMTVIKGVNDSHAGEYAALIRKSGADYVEAKAYMALGSSRARLGAGKMPSHAEIKRFAAALAGESGYIAADEHEPSRVVLLCRDDMAAASRIIKLKSLDEPADGA
ncbi:MAG: 4-demethylwyosine synthase TYW1 [Candidatus Micrarchaeota archaeon]